jgi:Rod binding domain-containing protein
VDIKPLTADALAALQAQATSPHAAALGHRQALELKKLKKAASEFESMLISSWWNTMKQSGLPGTDDDTDPGKGTLDQMGINALSSAIANGKGGLGLGNMLVHSMMKRMELHDAKAGSPSPTGGVAEPTKALRTHAIAQLEGFSGEIPDT